MRPVFPGIEAVLGRRCPGMVRITSAVIVDLCHEESEKWVLQERRRGRAGEGGWARKDSTSSFAFAERRRRILHFWEPKNSEDSAPPPCRCCPAAAVWKPPCCFYTMTICKWWLRTVSAPDFPSQRGANLLSYTAWSLRAVSRRGLSVRPIACFELGG